MFTAEVVEKTEEKLNVLENLIQERYQYHDTLAFFDNDIHKLTVEVYYGDGDYSVYSYDGVDYKVNKDSVLEYYGDYHRFEDETHQNIFEMMSNSYSKLCENYTLQIMLRIKGLFCFSKQDSSFFVLANMV